MKNYKEELDRFIEIVNPIEVEGEAKIIISTEYNRQGDNISYLLLITIDGKKITLMELKGTVKNEKHVSKVEAEKRIQNVFSEKALYGIKHFLYKSLAKTK